MGGERRRAARAARAARATSAAEGEVIGGGVPQRPIILSSKPCGRRINKVA